MIPVALDELPALRVVRGDGSVRVTGVTTDSRAVEPGDLFVAVRAGHDHAAEAVGAGAVAGLAEEGRAEAVAPGAGGRSPPRTATTTRSGCR